MRRPALLLVLACLASPFAAFAADDDASVDRREDVVYGRKHGTALTMNVFRPRRGANGVGLVLVVSGGWTSPHPVVYPPFVKPMTDRGYTVFAVFHGSQPRYAIPDILGDLHRAVRFVRHHAGVYGVDPGRLGIYGASAGGHLSLMQGTAGEPGDPDAKDPVDRESSRVQAVACFFPPTDFLNYGRAGESALGRGVLEALKAPFDFQELDPKRKVFVPVVDHAEVARIGRRISPAYHVSPDDPPTLIVHGDADKVVPIQQAERIVAMLKEAGVAAKLVVKPGAGHGWPELTKDLGLFADWFDERLKAREGASDGARPRPEARADRLPRKVIVGTVVLRPYAEASHFEGRIEELAGLVDAMAREASEKNRGRGLDLAILPETAATPTGGPASARARPLEGRVAEAFGALARRHKTYLVVPMDLAERGPRGTTYANAAVLFDRRGEVAGIYRKVHPVAVAGRDDLEEGITPGAEHPVFACDFGTLGIQICWDMQFDDGWDVLARRGAEIVVWPSASPATALPAARAGRHRYYVVSSTWRDNATVYEPTGLVAAQVVELGRVLVHQLDLSHALLGWSRHLDNGKALTAKYGDRVGYHYEPREDLGLFWSNDPTTTIGTMIRSLGLEEVDAQVRRNRRLQDAARGGPAPGP